MKKNDYLNLIANQLDLDINKLPLGIKPEQVSKVFAVKVETLSYWRATGRHGIPYIKFGGRIMYPLDGLAEYLANRTYTHTGEEAA